MPFWLAKEGKFKGAGIYLPLSVVRKCIPEFRRIFVLHSRRKSKGKVVYFFLRVMMFFFSIELTEECTGCWSCRELQCSTCIALWKIFTECDVYQSEEINQKFSENTRKKSFGKADKQKKKE